MGRRVATFHYSIENYFQRHHHRIQAYLRKSGQLCSSLDWSKEELIAQILRHADPNPPKRLKNNPILHAFNLANRHGMHKKGAMLLQAPNCNSHSFETSTKEKQTSTPNLHPSSMTHGVNRMKTFFMRLAKKISNAKQAPTLSETRSPMSMKKIVSLAKSPKFYKTHKWKRLRYKVLAQHGPNPYCSCCRRVCNEHTGGAQVDHIKPRSLYPELALDINNLQLLCGDCNEGKGCDGLEDWRQLQT